MIYYLHTAQCHGGRQISQSSCYTLKGTDEWKMGNWEP
jgi:hypothetical protein